MGLPLSANVVAHTGGGDLPLPLWQFVYAGVAVLIATQLTLRATAWRPSLVSGHPLPALVESATSVVAVVLRVLGVVVWVVVLAAAWLGTDNSRENLAPNVVWVVLWAGLHGVSAVLGDVWRVLSPYDTVASVAQWLRRRRRPGPARELPDDGTFASSHWLAAAGAAGFAWLELCYHRPEGPRVLAVVITAYSAVMLAGAARFGRGWLRTSEMFAAVFGLFAAMAPFFCDDDGQLRVRAPLTGLATVRARASTVVLVAVLIAAVGFDGVAATQWWSEVLGARLGWARTLVNTAGFAAVLTVVLGTYLAATRSAGSTADARRYVGALVPMALGLAVAHHFSPFVVEAQSTLPLVSDPFGKGWDLFGFGSPNPNLGIVSPATTAWVQAVAIVGGHVGAVAVIHAVARRQGGRPRTTALLGFVVASTGASLALALG